MPIRFPNVHYNNPDQFVGVGLRTEKVNAPVYTIGTGNFTIQFNMRIAENVASQLVGLLDCRPIDGAGIYPVLYRNANGTIAYDTNGVTRITSVAVTSTLTWYNIALIRSAGVTKLYINGTQSGSSYTDSNSYVISVLNIGMFSISGTSTYRYVFPGWLADFRITLAAEYTTNFTPPTTSFLEEPVTGPELYIEMVDEPCMTPVGPIPVTDSTLCLTADTPGTYKIRITSWEGSALPYDDFMNSLSLDYRWRMSSGFVTHDATEASVGSIPANIIMKWSGYGQASYGWAAPSLIYGTKDNYCVGTRTDGFLDSAPGDYRHYYVTRVVPTGNTPIMIGGWFKTFSTPTASGSYILSTNFAGAGDPGTYKGCILRWEQSGLLYLHFGNNGGASSANRASYASTTGLVTNSGTYSFLLYINTTNSGATIPTFRLYLNGALVTMNFVGGDATTVSWFTNTHVDNGIIFGMDTYPSTATCPMHRWDDLFIDFGSRTNGDLDTIADTMYDLGITPVTGGSGSAPYLDYEVTRDAV
jgi:hypothetical protein